MISWDCTTAHDNRRSLVLPRAYISNPSFLSVSASIHRLNWRTHQPACMQPESRFNDGAGATRQEHSICSFPVRTTTRDLVRVRLCTVSRNQAGGDKRVRVDYCSLVAAEPSSLAVDAGRAAPGSQTYESIQRSNELLESMSIYTRARPSGVQSTTTTTRH